MYSPLILLDFHAPAAAATAVKSLQSCPTLCDPIDGKPTRLPRPWDSPGKNTGVGYHFLLQCMKVKSESKVAQSCPTLSDLMDCSPPGNSVHGIFQARVLEWGAMVLITLYPCFLPDTANFLSQLYFLPHVCVCSIASVVSDSLRPHGLARLLCPWDSPGKNTGVGCHALLQEIFLTQGSKPCLLHCRQNLYH